MAIAKKATPKKKSTARKTPAKNSTSKKPSQKQLHAAQSFKIVSSDTPFFSFTVTRQSLYWLIFMAAVLALGLWVIHLQDKINQIYDRIDANASQVELQPDDIKALKQIAEQEKKNKN